MNEIQTIVEEIEQDVKDIKQDIDNIHCKSIYDLIKHSLKFIIDSFRCFIIFKKKSE